MLATGHGLYSEDAQAGLVSEQPALYFDLGSPYACLASERAPARTPGGARAGTDPARPGFGHLPRRGLLGRAPARARRAWREVERRTAAYGLSAVRWAEGWPSNTLKAMRMAVVRPAGRPRRAFSLAAFRPAFTHGPRPHASSPRLIVAAACELRPRRCSRRDRDPSDQGRPARGHQRGRPARRPRRAALPVGYALFYGDDRLEEAAAALGGEPPALRPPARARAGRFGLLDERAVEPGRIGSVRLEFPDRPAARDEQRPEAGDDELRP